MLHLHSVKINLKSIEIQLEIITMTILRSKIMIDIAKLNLICQITKAFP